MFAKQSGFEMEMDCDDVFNISNKILRTPIEPTEKLIPYTYIKVHLPD